MFTDNRSLKTLSSLNKKYYSKAGTIVIACVGAFVYLSVVAVLLLKWIEPPASSFMVQRQIEAWWEGNESFSLHYEWTSWNRISPYLKVAAVTSEDQNFADHWGFDLGSIQKAIEEYQKGEDLRGASTVTQQVAKNLFLWSDQTYFRKGIEAWFTLLIEAIWTKKRILEVYLNIAEFGNGIYGVKAASETYFNTTPARINMQESALMMTALPSPRRYDLANPSSYMIKRRNWILQYMFYLGNTRYLEKLE